MELDSRLDSALMFLLTVSFNVVSISNILARRCTGQWIELLCQHNQSLRKPLKLVATVAVAVEASLVTLTITGNQVCTFGSGRALPFRGAFKT